MKHAIAALVLLSSAALFSCRTTETMKLSSDGQDFWFFNEAYSSVCHSATPPKDCAACYQSLKLIQHRMVQVAAATTRPGEYPLQTQATIDADKAMRKACTPIDALANGGK
jgi:hypothetical protein